MTRRLLTLTLALLAALALVSPVWAGGGWGNDGTRTLIAEVDNFKIVTLTKFGLEVSTETYVSGARTTAGQALAGDLNLGAAWVGNSTDPIYVGGVMGNLIGTGGSAGTKNILSGVAGKFSVTGTISSTYVASAVRGEIGDGSTGAQAAVLAVMGGDTATTTARSAFGVDWQSSVPQSTFDFGLDLQGGGTHDGYKDPRYNKGDIRLGGRSINAAAGGDDVVIWRFAGTATTQCNDICGPGSLNIDTTNGKLYINTGTKASNTWTLVGGQS